MNDFTRCLEQAAGGDARAADSVFPHVYGELRRIAAAQLGRESPGQTLQPTALVHEAWLRLTAGDPRPWNGREHFVAAAAEAMRRILVDRARSKRCLKRGSAPERLEWEESLWEGPEADERVLEVHEALEHLERSGPELAHVVKLRFFGGMKHEEIAEALGVNEKTVRRRWELARVRLCEAIRDSR